MPKQRKIHREPQPEAPLPQQRPVDEEEFEPRSPSLLKRVLTRIGIVLLLILALVFAYVFLLLGEPEEEAKDLVMLQEETITMPMSPLEAPGESNVQHLADTFGQPVLSLYNGPEMQKARVYDTAFEGGYARRVTLTYTFDDGQQLTVESLRPTAAATLLKSAGARLDATSLYALGGLNAARMDDDNQICVFGQSDTAVYAVICPQSHAGDLTAILRQTVLVDPSTGE